jgi:hypothetical protein
MADLSIFEKYPGSFRLDHPDFSNVSKSPYALGVITAFYEANGDDPVVAKDVCDLTIGGQEFKEVPIFYHQQKDYAENWKLNADPSIHAYGGLMSASAAWADFWKAAGALVDGQGKPITDMPKEGLPFKDQAVARGAYSFSVGDEVAVMLRDGEPVAVIGFADGIPRRPFDYVKVDMPSQVLDTNDDINPPGDPHCPYILQLSDSDRASTPSGPNPGYSPPTGLGLGPDGFDLKLLKDAKVFPDKTHSDGGHTTTDLIFDYNYYCFYQSEVMGNRIELIGTNWNPPSPPYPSTEFGPYNGNMYFGFGAYSPWADYLNLWLGICDTKQVAYGGVDEPYVGLWPNGLGRPLFWAITASDGYGDSNTDYVMRTYLIEAGPILYLVRVFYQHTVSTGHGNTYLWKNRIVWPWDPPTPPPEDWAGYPAGGRMSWTSPIWPFNANPTPNKIEDCIPQPDDVLSGTTHQETFYGDNPHYIYAAPSSKKILDSIESLVAASNAKVDVNFLGGTYPEPPDGFRNIFGNGTSFTLTPGFIPPVGNLRELNFKIAARIGA